jgi:2-alkenal reductase
MEPGNWPDKRIKSGSNLLVAALVGLLCGAVGVLAGAVLTWLLLMRVAQPHKPAPTTSVALPAPAQPLAGSADPVRDAPARVAKEVGPAVVTVVSELPSQSSFFGTYQPPPARGSGVIIDPRGYIVTNQSAMILTQR